MCYGFRVHTIRLDFEEDHPERYSISMQLGRVGRGRHDFGVLIYSDDHPLEIAERLDALAGEIRSRMRSGF